ncbi:short-chain dehydrogenase/reductase SDR [Protomyces lactucae-debilis]|uniref:Short-chain dehydrogenase/reductase SDR n=1 Tax=Protomyces lactucae-debilis TaxID=2754530 RepID=A0A1Y2ERE5_PROLT|nr:short-chain dehydrogenase/reductase SDR [Protomyces lactucae-debilis]ORY74118.1 short-chain dehydrogenase/reductase SDR [Protomyces lactucae-debilis]
MLLRDKVVVVSGASSGIGKAVAKACLKHGAQVVAHHIGDAQSSGDIKELEALGATLVAGDIRIRETAQAIVEIAITTFGKLDVVVANAGICKFETFLEVSDSLLESHMDVNYYGVFYLVQEAARAMKRLGQGGSIIGISSISALVGGGQQCHYTPTKAAVKSLMQSCAIALGPHGIRCNSILPGQIETPMSAADLAVPEKRAKMVARVPLGRLGQPEDIADPVVFLASDMSAYVNGAELLVDGGLFVNLQ